MKVEIQKLISKYSNHLINGNSIIKELEIRGQESSCLYRKQQAINKIWDFFIKDLTTLADKEDNANHRKKTPKPGPSSNK